MDTESIEPQHTLLRQPKTAADLPAPRRHQLVQEGALAELFMDGSEPAVQVLHAAVTDHPLQAIRDLAWIFLKTLAGQANIPAQDAICSLAIDQDQPDARQVALAENYVPTDEQRRALFFLLTGQTKALQLLDPDFQRLIAGYQSAETGLRKRVAAVSRSSGLEEWEQVVRAIIDDEAAAWDNLVEKLPLFQNESVRALFFSAVGEMAQQKHELALRSLFRLFLEKEYLPSRDAALSTGVLPSNPEERALFLLLTGQWERFESLDFDLSYLSAAYESAPPALRRRVIAATRRSGRLDWLQALSSGRRIRLLGDMTEADWEAVTELLKREQKYAELWRLAQSATPIWSAKLLLWLGEQGWKPDQEEQQPGFANLLNLAGYCVEQEIQMRKPQTLGGVFRNLNCLALSPDGRRVACGTAEGSVQVWLLPERFPQLVIPSPAGQAWALAFSPNGEYLAGGYGDHTVRIWRVEDGRLVKTLDGHQSTVRSIAISPDGRQLGSASFDGGVKLWRFPYGPELRSFAGHPSEVFCVQFSPDGQTLASGGADNQIRLWSLDSGQLLRSWEAHNATVTALAYTQDASLLASGGRDHNVQLWAMPEGNLIKTIQEHQAMVSGLAVQPSGRILTSAGLDGMIALWSLPEGQRILAFKAHPDAIAGVAFFPEGESLISAGAEGSLSIWDLKPLLYLRLPADRTTLKDIQRIQAILDEESLPAAARRWFEFALGLNRWRRRFDISLAEREHIQVGEYDIELG
ncbi:MAG TPA: WD40 repeat domain-containing protein [Anaerolineaceae bacterium]|nr:WD40 repeat domain-containing protein [Anaerolineaceae bacterium]